MVRYHSPISSKSLTPTLSLAGESPYVPKPQPPNWKKRKRESGLEIGSKDRLMNEAKNSRARFVQSVLLAALGVTYVTHLPSFRTIGWRLTHIFRCKMVELRTVCLTWGLPTCAPSTGTKLAGSSSLSSTSTSARGIQHISPSPFIGDWRWMYRVWVQVCQSWFGGRLHKEAESGSPQIGWGIREGRMKTGSDLLPSSFSYWRGYPKLLWTHLRKESQIIACMQAMNTVGAKNSLQPLFWAFVVCFWHMLLTYLPTSAAFLQNSRPSYVSRTPRLSIEFSFIIHYSWEPSHFSLLGNHNSQVSDIKSFGFVSWIHPPF